MIKCHISFVSVGLKVTWECALLIGVKYDTYSLWDSLKASEGICRSSMFNKLRQSTQSPPPPKKGKTKNPFPFSSMEHLPTPAICIV